MPTLDRKNSVDRLKIARDKLTCFINVIYRSGCLMDEEIRDLEEIESILFDVIDEME